MCLSPDQMSAEQLQRRVNELEKMLDGEALEPYYQNLYTGRLTSFRELLEKKTAAPQPA